MNKTIDISLAGILFHLDETAYYKLKKYLRAVKSSLKGTEDIAEVMNEIEARIAELLLEKQAHPQQVIDNSNIDEIISIMGQPEDYEDELDATTTSHTKRSVKKGLFRDMDKSVLGGVAAGIAHYLGIDVTLTRLIMLGILFFTHAAIVPIYLLLWIIVPKAKTASDKLRMKGEKVDVDSIVDQVSTEEDSGKKKIKLGEKVEDSSKEIGSIIVKILGLIIVLITGIVISALAVSIVALLPFGTANHILPGLPLDSIIGISTNWAGILAILLVGIPFVILFLLGFKMLFPNSKSVNKNIFIVAGTIWFLSLVFVVGKTTSVLAHKSVERRVLAEEIHPLKATDTLFLNEKELFANVPENYVSTPRTNYKFYPSHDADFHIKIYKISEGLSRKSASNNAHKIKYMLLKDSLHNRFTFSKQIIYPNKNLVSERKIRIEVHIPNNAVVKLSKRVSYHTRNLHSDNPKIVKNNNGDITSISEYEALDFDDTDETISVNGKNLKIKINEDGIDLYTKDHKNNAAHVTIDEDGINIKAIEKKGDSASINIGKKGIEINNKNSKNE